MKTYTGARTFDGVVVLVDGLPLAPRGDLRTYSLKGYEWGYEGLDPSQLALAILADAAGDEAALAFAPAFMTEIVANFDNEWEITEEQVVDALQALRTLES
ncbi:MAG: DUF6166 domain-containing protein [Burkholderiaceae bacterium]